MYQIATYPLVLVCYIHLPAADPDFFKYSLSVNVKEDKTQQILDQSDMEINTHLLSLKSLRFSFKDKFCRFITTLISHVMWKFAYML